MGIIGTALRWVLVLIVVAAVGAYLVLATPIFAGFRQSMAQPARNPAQSEMDPRNKSGGDP